MQAKKEEKHRLQSFARGRPAAPPALRFGLWLLVSGSLWFRAIYWGLAKIL
jgi:hypothetical protein